MDSFLASLAPEPYVVLGVKLKRLTFGHVVLLNRFGVDPVKTVVDLVLAVQICSRDYKDALSYVDSLSTRKRGILNWWFVRRVKKLDISAAIEAWQEYLKENSHQPEYAKGDSSPPRKGAPVLAQIRAFLLTHCNYNPDTLMNHFYGQCLWDYGAVVEEHAGEGIVGEYHNRIADLLRN